MNYFDALNQTPEIWKLAAETPPNRLLSDEAAIVLCGCGTSFYMAAQLANLLKIRGRDATAAEAADFFSDQPHVPDPKKRYVFISRSGESMESVLAMREAKRAFCRTFYVGCARDSTLARECDGMGLVEFAKEPMILESYSFGAQMLCLWRCMGLIAGPEATYTCAQNALKAAQDVYEARCMGMNASRLIALGAPFYMPLMREVMLKNGEITKLPSEAWGILEYRHGPRSWIDENSLVTLIPGEKSAAFEEKVAQELAGYGARVLWLGQNAPGGTLRVALDQEKFGIMDVLSVSLFTMALAARIGEGRKIDAANPARLLYAVEDLK